nr:uncharacterized protein K02A2.6-like [Vanessa tameamea]
MAASRMQRWAILLSGYSYEVEYIHSDKNAADALSWLPAGKVKNSTTEKTKEVIKNHVSKDVVLILIDSTSKWLEIFQMQRTTAGAVVKVLRETFARFGLPREVFSDHGPLFSSSEYKDFMNNNGIKVTYTAIYHPASNGAAEGAVKLCKRAIKKSMQDGYDLDAALQSYLLDYRNVEYSTTGVAPATILQKRRPHSRLDLLRSDVRIENKVQAAQMKQIAQAGGSNRSFNLGDKV